jgi:putative sterol carrier protein
MARGTEKGEAGGGHRGFAVLKNLAPVERPTVRGTLQGLGELLASSGLQLTFQLQLHDASDASHYVLALDGMGAKVSTASTPRPDLELITTQATWMAIAAGKLAPIAAFLGGRMRVRGNATLAQQLLKLAAGSDGRTQLCERR